MAKQAGTYLELLKDSRWQKRRLEVFLRDKWACLRCGRTDLTLHVHHKKYTGMPWEAPGEDLETICEKCHRNEHIIIIDEKPSEIGATWPMKWRNNTGIISINKQITTLNDQLKSPQTDIIMTEILTTIVNLQKRRRELSDAK